MASGEIVISVVMVAIVLGLWVILEELAKANEEEFFDDDNDLNGAI